MTKMTNFDMNAVTMDLLFEKSVGAKYDPVNILYHFIWSILLIVYDR